MVDNNDAQRMELEARRIDGDLRLRSEELELRREELRQNAAKSRIGGWSSPVTLTLLGGAITILSGMALATWQGSGNLKLERQKFESALILKAIETGDQQVAAKNLLFLLNLGLISDPNGKIAGLAANPDQAPVLPTTGATPVPVTEQARASFYDGYRKAFGRTSSEQVAALESVFSAISNNGDLTDVRQVAYVLATIQFETAQTFKPMTEYGSETSLEERYGGTRGLRYGNTQPGDGARYRGRGYVQLLGRANYAKLNVKLGLKGTPDDLIVHPERALEPSIAYRIQASMMREGLATGLKLDDYIHGDKADYVNARKIVNGLDRAVLIAENAKKLEAILRASLAEEAR